MNKPQYLAELRRLLVFMTAADRERTISRCGELFDQAGPDGADGVIAEIGSPTRVSIRLSRTYAPGRLDLSSLNIRTVAPEPEPEPELEPPAPEVVEGLPDLDVPDLVMDDLSGFEMIPPESKSESESEPGPEQEPSAPEEDAPEPGPAPPVQRQATPTERPAPRFVAMPLDEGDAFDEPEKAGPDVVIERVMPIWVGIPLFIICLFVLALPIGALCIILLPILLLPGLALLLGTWLTAVGGLWCTSYIADALMLFGLAALILSVALLVLWAGLRLDVGIVSLYARGCRAVSHLTLGRKVIRDA